MAYRTLLQLRHAASLRVRDLWRGTLTAAAATSAVTVDSSNRQELVDFFTNGFLHINLDVSLHAAEDLRLLGNGPGVLTLVQPGVQVAHDDNTAYEIHKICSVEDYNQFIIDALIDLAGEAILGNQESTALSITANANKATGMENEYTIPTGMRYITEIMIANAAGVYEDAIPLTPDCVQVLPGTTKRLRLSTYVLSLYGAVGRGIRILGMGEQDASALLDATTVGGDASFITEHVVLSLLRFLARGRGAAAQAALNQINPQTQLVELKREEAGQEARVLPGSLVVPI